MALRLPSKLRRKTMKWLGRLDVSICFTECQANEPSATSCSSSGGGFQRIKVYSHKKESTDLSFVCSGEAIKAHRGAILAASFSPGGEYLATGGDDGVVCVWRVIDRHCPNRLAALSATAGHKEKHKGVVSATRIVIPLNLFAISDKPVQEFVGHAAEILGLSWSSDKVRLLSSSADYTVRLWKLGGEGCIGMYRHGNYVNCIQFNPADETHFISGSIDGKVRVWDIGTGRVVDWADVREIITTICYRPSGEGFVVGTITGNCRFYDVSGRNMSLEAQVSLGGKKKSAQKKITGFQFSPCDPSVLMVTTSDAKIRILESTNIVQTYKNSCSGGSCRSSAAAFTADGRRIVLATDKSAILIWNHNRLLSSQLRSAKTEIAACESFICGDTAIAVPWNGPAPVLPPFCAMASAVAQRGKSTMWPEEVLIAGCVRSGLVVKPLKRGPPSDSWGQVIVTAGQDGYLRWFQNFSLPVHG